MILGSLGHLPFQKVTTLITPSFSDDWKINVSFQVLNFSILNDSTPLVNITTPEVPLPLLSIILNCTPIVYDIPTPDLSDCNYTENTSLGSKWSMHGSPELGIIDWIIYILQGVIAPESYKCTTTRSDEESNVWWAPYKPVHQLTCHRVAS